MSEQWGSPKTMSRSGTALSPLKGKAYLPSRYSHELVQSKGGTQDILNTIEVNVKGSQGEKNPSSHSPTRHSRTGQRSPNFRTRKQPAEFKPRPLKREESDLQNFKEIFLEPRMMLLDHIKETANTVPCWTSQRSREPTREQGRDFGKVQSNEGQRDKLDELGEVQVQEHYKQCIQMLTNAEEDTQETLASDFYEQQISIDPPDMPNSSVASTLSPGAGYAPSIPLSLKMASKKANLTELLMRAKAGTSTEQVQKQAHLSFYLGAVYEEKRQYRSALKFYRRFLGFAKTMQDKIGMSLGANRVAVNYFRCGQTAKSVSFHNQNLKLSDSENSFAAYYNLGICHRKLGRYEDAQEYFEAALQWTLQHGEEESECLTLAQIGMNYLSMQLYQQSFDSLEKSVQICRKTKNIRLKQCNLLHMMLVAARFGLKATEAIEQLAREAHECACALGDNQMQEVFSCNIGIIRGRKQFEGIVRDTVLSSDTQLVENECSPPSSLI